MMAVTVTLLVPDPVAEALTDDARPWWERLSRLQTSLNEREAQLVTANRSFITIIEIDARRPRETNNHDA